VVGAAGGVGIEVVRGLIDRNFHVVGTVLDAAQLQQVQDSVPGIGQILIIELSAAEKVKASLGPILGGKTCLSAVAVCAGISPYGPLETVPLAELRRTFEINTVAAVGVYQAVMPDLRATRGRLALISSISGRVAFPLTGHYSASKFALEALGDVMRREAKKWGVNVIIVEPAGLKTSMASEFQRQVMTSVSALSDDERELYGDMYQSLELSLRGTYEKSTPPAEVAAVIVEALAMSDPPQTRYQVGPDSAHIYHISRSLNDSELDAVAHFGGADAECPYSE